MIAHLLPKTITKVIKESDGNLVLAASRLDVTVSRLDRAIQMSREVMQTVAELKRCKAYAKYNRMSLESIKEDIETRIVLYRSDALDALHDLAMMPISQNSMQNQVKLMAAQRLFGETRDPHIGHEINATLAALNADFQANAPRIRAIRETVREYQMEPPAIDVTPTATSTPEYPTER